MHTYKLLLIILLILYTPLARAEIKDALQLTSSDAVVLALRENESLMAARAAIDKAGAYARYAGRLDNPELKLDYASDKTFNDEGEQGYSVGFEQRFPITNRLQLLKDVSAREVQLAEAELRNQQRQLIRNVESAIEAITSLEDRLSLLNEVIIIQQDFATFLKKRIQIGEASTLDLNQVRVTLFSAKQKVQSLNKERHTAMGRLRTSLGLKQHKTVNIVSESIDQDALSSMVSMDAEALKSHPEYQFKTLLAEVAKGQTAVAKAERWADIAVEIFFEEERAVDEPIGLERDRFFGIGVSIPLPLHNKNHAEIEASRHRERAIYHELRALRLRLYNEAETLRLNARATHQQLIQYNANAVSLVEQNLAEITQAYAAGQVDLGEVFRLQEQRLEIKMAQIELRHQLEQIHIDWRAATARNLTTYSTKGVSNAND